MSFPDRRAYDLLEPMFEACVLGEEGQGVLDSQDSWDEILDSLPDDGKFAGVCFLLAACGLPWVALLLTPSPYQNSKDVAARLRREMPRCTTAQGRWQEIKKALAAAGPSGSASSARTPAGKKGGKVRVCLRERERGLGTARAVSCGWVPHP